MEHNPKKYKSLENQYKYKILENVFGKCIRCISRISGIKCMEYPTYMHNTSRPLAPKKTPLSHMIHIPTKSLPPLAWKLHVHT